MNEEKLIQYRLDKERKEKILRKEAYVLHLLEEEKHRQKAKQGIIEQLAKSDMTPEEIIKQSAQQNADFHRPFDPHGLSSLVEEFDDTAALMLDHDSPDHQFDPMDHLYEDPSLFVLHEHYHDPWTSSLTADKSVRGGGYQSHVTHQRALSSAFSGLFVGIV